LGRYNVSHIKELTEQAHARFGRLLNALQSEEVLVYRGKDTMMVCTSDIRIAVDDFKTILSEIRRLK